jgi:LysM repeat protein
LNLVRAWWDWCSESLGHTFAGVTAPLLLLSGLFVIIFYATSGGDEPLPQPPRSDVAGICVTATPGPAGTTVCGTDGLTALGSPTPPPPTPTPAPKTYTVKSGDNLSRICASQVASMDSDACIAGIADLSGLSGPDEMIYEGQQLKLPPSSGSASASTNHATPPTPTTAVQAPTQIPTATSEPEPTPSASLTAIDPTQAPADDSSDETAVEEETPEATEASDDTADATEEATAEPEDATPTDAEVAAGEGREYTVESGDSLSSICATEVDDMSDGDCVEFVVLLNNLDGPDQIAAGDTILIP